jgi:hypothetical protein
MDPGPDATVFPFGVFDKAEPSRLNVLECKKCVGLSRIMRLGQIPGMLLKNLA